MDKYPKITLDDNPNITQAEYRQACQIGRVIQDIILMQPSYVKQREVEAGLAQPSEIWKNTKGEPAYGVMIKGNILEPSYDMVNHLRLHTSHFTGYSLANIISEEVIPSWTDNIAGNINPEFVLNTSDWSVGAFLETIQGLPSDLVCKPPIKLGEVGWLVNGGVVNRDVMGCQERVTLLYESGIIDEMRQRERVNIIEIGSGYGGLAYFMKQILPSAKYFACDLPLSLFYSAVYLSLVNDLDDNLIYTGRNREELFDDRSGFIFVPNFLFADLVSIKFDLAINTLSFAEMEPSAVESYVRNLAFMLRDSGFLFEQNFDNSHFRLPTFCNPEETISRYFKVGRTLTEFGRWGPARLWSNHNTPLETKPYHYSGLLAVMDHFPRLVDSYKGYKLVNYSERTYGIPISLGHVDLTREKDRNRPGIVTAETLQEVRDLVDKAVNTGVQRMPIRSLVRRALFRYRQGGLRNVAYHTLGFLQERFRSWLGGR